MTFHSLQIPVFNLHLPVCCVDVVVGDKLSLHQDQVSWRKSVMFIKTQQLDVNIFELIIREASKFYSPALKLQLMSPLIQHLFVEPHSYRLMYFKVLCKRLTSTNKRDQSNWYYNRKWNECIINNFSDWLILDMIFFFPSTNVNYLVFEAPGMCTTAFSSLTANK